MRMRVSLGVLVAAIVSFADITPAAAQSAAQQADTAIGETQIAAYAKAYAAIASERDKAHAEFALPRNKTDQIQRDLRERLQKQIEQILKANELTQERFERITYVLSIDGERRRIFEQSLARLTPKP
jgi:hypothetical protein